ncbi:MAG: SRPBCC family protein [Sporichthyaceae bacterium]
MATVRHHLHVNAAPDDVFKVIADAGSISNWFGPIVSSSSTPTGRIVTLGDGTEINEDTVTSDNELRRFQYAIKSGLPVDHHIGTFDVLPDGDGSLVIYAADVAPDELGPVFDGVMAEGIKGLKDYCER